MTNPTLNGIKEKAETIETFAGWFAETWHGRQKVKVLCLTLASVFIFFNPLMVETILANVPGLGKSLLNGLSPWYAPAFWAFVTILFITTLVIAVRQKKPVVVPPTGRNTPVKGLRPFQFRDAELFTRLQREDALQVCLANVTDSEFRMGILSGESGAGKTSFLQAGLWPRLLEQNYRCVYVKVTDLHPMEAIRRAIHEQLNIPFEELQQSTLLEISGMIREKKMHPLVLILDQFEQVFVHLRTQKERKPLLKIFADWYQNKNEQSTKVLLCMRDDYVAKVLDFQQPMDFSLSPVNNFLLKKMEPYQAKEIFRVIAEAEGLDFDEGFVESLTHAELLNKDDGLVSPVDVQIYAWMIRGQKGTGKAAFDRKTYQEMGGIEGLLERFLKDTLVTRETHAKQEYALKVILALIDLDRNTRVGVLNVEQLKEKITDVDKKEVENAVLWLAKSDVRLITFVKEREGYELAHERIIPAVRRLAGKTLSRAEQANQLLDRRVNEWLANNRSGHYLFSFRQWRRIKRQETYLSWGRLEKQKKELLLKSRQRTAWHAGIAATVVVLLSCFAGWLNSASGTKYLIKEEVYSLCQETNDIEALTGAVIAFHRVNDREKSEELYARLLDVTGKINVGTIPGQYSSKPIAVALAESIVAFSDVSEGALLDKALQLTRKVTNDSFRASALSHVASRFALRNDLSRAEPLFAEAIALARTLKEDTLFSRIMKTQSWYNIASSLAETRNLKYIQQGVGIAKNIDFEHYKAKTLENIVSVLASTEEAKLLQRAGEIAHAIPTANTDDSSYKAIALVEVISARFAADKHKNPKKLVSDTLLPPAMAIVEKVNEASINWNNAMRNNPNYPEGIAMPAYNYVSGYPLAIYMMDLSSATKDTSNLRNSIDLAAQIFYEQYKNKALSRIVAALSTLKDSTAMQHVLSKGSIQNYFKAFSFSSIADALIALNQPFMGNSAINVLLAATKQYTIPEYRDPALAKIVRLMTKAGGWEAAHQQVKYIEIDKYKIVALSHIIESWAVKKVI